MPRPDWYFFFLFELLRVLKPPYLVPLATIGIPTIAMVLLFLLPFYDRNPERNPVKRPIATTAGILTIAAMAYLTFAGAVAGSPAEIDLQVPPEDEAGKLVAAQSGCLACQPHRRQRQPRARPGADRGWSAAESRSDLPLACGRSGDHALLQGPAAVGPREVP